MGERVWIAGARERYYRVLGPRCELVRLQSVEIVADGHGAKVRQAQGDCQVGLAGSPSTA